MLSNDFWPETQTGKAQARSTMRNADSIPEGEHTQQEVNSTPEDNGGNGDRLFTQQEVNRIVAERLARERSKSGPTEEDQKAQELERERLRLEFQKMLFEGEYPVDAIMYFFDHIDLSSVDGFQTTMQQLDALLEAYLAQGEKLRRIRAANGVESIGTPRAGMRPAEMDAAIKEIFRRGGRME